MLHSRNSLDEVLRSELQSIAAGKYKAVHSRAMKMIKTDLKDPVPYCLLGAIAAEHGNHVKACELFERASLLGPETAFFHAYHGKALSILGHQNQAKIAADTAAKYPIKDAYLADTIGVIYSRTGFHELAVPFFAKAVALDASRANFYYNLAASQQFLGNLDDAEAAYFKTLEQDRTVYRAWSSIVGLKTQTVNANYLEKLVPLYEELSSDEDAALHLGHAIAKTLEDLARYEESLDWLHKAKSLKRAKAYQEFNLYDELFAAAKATAAPSTQAAEDYEVSAPIFIVGLPRTGTTLVDRILSSHPVVSSAGELNFFPNLVKQATKTPSNLVLDRETLERSSQIDLSEIGQAYIDQTKSLARGAERFIDKMPLNFFYAGLIHRALPNARIVVLRRGPMDSCLSNYRQLLTVQQSYYQYTYDLKETAKFYLQFDELIAHFRATIPAQCFLEIHYENIVYEQEKETRRLLEFCNLEWDDACLSFHENSAPVATASSVQVRKPLYSGSIGRWKRYGDKLNDLKDTLGELADAN